MPKSVYGSQSPNFWELVIFYFVESLYIPGLGEWTPKGTAFGDTVALVPPNKKVPKLFRLNIDFRGNKLLYFIIIMINSFSFRQEILENWWSKEHVKKQSKSGVAWSDTWKFC